MNLIMLLLLRLGLRMLRCELNNCNWSWIRIMILRTLLMIERSLLITSMMLLMRMPLLRRSGIVTLLLVVYMMVLLRNRLRLFVNSVWRLWWGLRGLLGVTRGHNTLLRYGLGDGDRGWGLRGPVHGPRRTGVGHLD